MYKHCIGVEIGKIRSEDLRTQFDIQSDGVFRSILREIAVFDNNYYICRPDIKQLQTQVLTRCTPDNICLYEAAEYYRHRLEYYGIRKLFSMEGMEDLWKRFVEETNDQEKNALECIKKELDFAPWNLSLNFIKSHVQRRYRTGLMLKIDEESVDGISYLIADPLVPREERKQTHKTGGQEIDLRRLTNPEAAKILRLLGVEKEDIPQLRWQRRNKIRTIVSGMDPQKVSDPVIREIISKFSRAGTNPYAHAVGEYESKCQKAFDRQRMVLSFTDDDDSSMSDEDQDDSIFGSLYRQPIVTGDVIVESPRSMNVPSPISTLRSSSPHNHPLDLASSEKSQSHPKSTSLISLSRGSSMPSLSRLPSSTFSQSPSPSSITTTNEERLMEMERSLSKQLRELEAGSGSPSKSSKSLGRAQSRMYGREWSDSESTMYESDDSHSTVSRVSRSSRPMSPVSATSGVSRVTRRALKVTHIRRDAEGKRTVQVEILTDPNEIQEFVNKQSQSHEAESERSKHKRKRKHKLSTQEEIREKQLQRKRRKIQEQLRLLRQKNIKSSEYVQLLKKGQLSGVGTRDVVCSKCGMPGHMKTNRECPLYDPLAEAAMKDDTNETAMKLKLNLGQSEGQEERLSVLNIRELKTKSDKAYAAELKEKREREREKRKKNKQKFEIDYKSTLGSATKRRESGRELLPSMALADILLKVVTSIFTNSRAAPFRKPVNVSSYPAYKKVISRPMDLSSIKDRLKEQTNHGDRVNFRSRDDFMQDIRQILENSRLFNGQNNQITMDADFLVQLCEAELEKHAQDLSRFEAQL